MRPRASASSSRRRRPTSSRQVARAGLSPSKTPVSASGASTTGNAAQASGNGAGISSPTGSPTPGWGRFHASASASPAPAPASAPASASASASAASASAAPAAAAASANPDARVATPDHVGREAAQRAADLQAGAVQALGPGCPLALFLKLAGVSSPAADGQQGSEGDCPQGHDVPAGDYSPSGDQGDDGDGDRRGVRRGWFQVSREALHRTTGRARATMPGHRAEQPPSATVRGRSISLRNRRARPSRVRTKDLVTAGRRRARPPGVRRRAPRSVQRSRRRSLKPRLPGTDGRLRASRAIPGAADPRRPARGRARAAARDSGRRRRPSAAARGEQSQAQSQGRGQSWGRSARTHLDHAPPRIARPAARCAVSLKSWAGSRNLRCFHAPSAQHSRFPKPRAHVRTPPGGICRSRPPSTVRAVQAQPDTRRTVGKRLKGALDATLARAIVTVLGFFDDVTIGPIVIGLSAVLPALATFVGTAVVYSLVQYGARERPRVRVALRAGRCDHRRPHRGRAADPRGRADRRPQSSHRRSRRGDPTGGHIDLMPTPIP